MAKGLDSEFIRESYSRFSDQELLRIISQDAHGLTPDAVEVVKAELAKRNLDPKLNDLVVAQNRDYTQEELNEFCRIIEKLPCPDCNSASIPLSCVSFTRTISVIYITFQAKRLAIGCPKCLKLEMNAALAISLALGWWGIPYGPFKTIQSIRNFSKANKVLRQVGPNDYLRGFVLSNIGLFTLHKNNKENINVMIQNTYNNRPITTGL